MIGIYDFTSLISGVALSLNSENLEEEKHIIFI